MSMTVNSNTPNYSSAREPLASTADLLKVASQYLPRPEGPSLGLIFRKTLETAAGEMVGGVPGNVFGDLKELMDLQVETQAKMQSISMLSNIERSKHESRMAAIRNIRAG